MTVKNKTELAVDKTFQMKNFKNLIGLKLFIFQIYTLFPRFKIVTS